MTKTPLTKTSLWSNKRPSGTLFRSCSAVWLSFKPILDISIFHKGLRCGVMILFCLIDSGIIFFCIIHTHLLLTRRDMLLGFNLFAHTASSPVSGLVPECCLVITLLIRSKNMHLFSNHQLKCVILLQTCPCFHLCWHSTSPVH